MRSYLDALGAVKAFLDVVVSETKRVLSASLGELSEVLGFKLSAVQHDLHPDAYGTEVTWGGVTCPPRTGPPEMLASARGGEDRMRKLRFKEEQIIAILRAAEAGQKLTDLCRKHGISEQTFYRWRAKYGGMDVSDARKLRALEDENRRLKTLVADLTLDNQMLNAVVQRKW
jgi:putative transposase